MGFIDNLRDAFSLKARSSPQLSNPNMAYGMQFVNPGSPVWTPRNNAMFVSNGYKRAGTVYAAVNKISIAAAGIKWKLYKDKSLENEITDHPLLDLWAHPNPQEGTASFILKQFGNWHISGNAYTWAVRPNPNEPPIALWALNPAQMKIIPGRGGIQEYVFGYGSPAEQRYAPENIMQWKFHAFDDEYYGFSPLECAMWLVDQITAGQEWNTALMQNFGKPSAVFTSKTYLTEPQRSQVRDELRRKYQGKRNAGMPLVLEADMQFQPMSIPPQELDWLKSRELNTREIAAIYDVAPELIGDSAGKTFANVAEARVALYQENALPKLDLVVDWVNNWLVPMYPDLAASKAVLTYDRRDIEALQGTYASAQQITSDLATSWWNSGQATFNEARARHGLPPIKGGDVLKFGVVLVPVAELQAYAARSAAPPPPPTIAAPGEAPQAKPVPGKQPPPKPAPGKQPPDKQDDEQQKKGISTHEPLPLPEEILTAGVQLRDLPANSSAGDVGESAQRQEPPPELTPEESAQRLDAIMRKFAETVSNLSASTTDLLHSPLDSPPKRARDEYRDFMEKLT